MLIWKLVKSILLIYLKNKLLVLYEVWGLIIIIIKMILLLQGKLCVVIIISIRLYSLLGGIWRVLARRRLGSIPFRFIKHLGIISCWKFLIILPVIPIKVRVHSQYRLFIHSHLQTIKLHYLHLHPILMGLLNSWVLLW